MDMEIEGNSQPIYDSTMSVDDIEDEELIPTAPSTLQSGDNLTSVTVAQSVNISSAEIAPVEMEIVELQSRGRHYVFSTGWVQTLLEYTHYYGINISVQSYHNGQDWGENNHHHSLYYKECTLNKITLDYRV